MTERGTGGRDRLVRLAGAAVAVLLVCLLSMPGFAGPSEAPQPAVPGLSTQVVAGLRFHFRARDQTLLAPLFRVTPQVRSAILADLSADALDDVDIYLLDELETYFRARNEPPRNPEWASGLALLGENVILIRLRPTAGGRLELERTLAHELSHIALHNDTGGRRLPHWLVEGFALLQTEAWTLTRAGPLAEAAVTGTVIPLWDLDASFPAHAQSAQLAYAEAGHFVRWLIQRHGRERFRKLLAGLGEGKPFKDAFLSAYGQSFESTEQVWREGLVIEDGWVAVMVASSTLFFAITVFFLGLYVRVRRERRAAFANLEAEPRPPVPRHLRQFGPFAPRP